MHIPYENAACDLKENKGGKRGDETSWKAKRKRTQGKSKGKIMQWVRQHDGNVRNPWDDLVAGIIDRLIVNMKRPRCLQRLPTVHISLCFSDLVICLVSSVM